MSDNSVTRIKPHDGVLLIEVCKRSLDDSSTRTLVDDVQTAAGQQPGLPIVLDLGRVKFAPSVALGSLVQLTKSFQFDGRRVALVRVGQRLLDAIHVTRLNQLLEIHDTVDEVLAGPPAGS